MGGQKLLKIVGHHLCTFPKGKLSFSEMQGLLKCFSVSCPNPMFLRSIETLFKFGGQSLIMVTKFCPLLPRWHWLGNSFTCMYMGKSACSYLILPVPPNTTYLPCLVNLVKKRPLTSHLYCKCYRLSSQLQSASCSIFSLF